MHTLFFLMMSHKSCRLFSFLFIHFSFWSSDCIFFTDFSSSLMILYSGCLGLLLKLSIEFFHSIIIFFSSKVSVCPPLCFLVFLLNFSFCSYIFIFLIVLYYLSVFSVTLQASVKQLILCQTVSGSPFLLGKLPEVYCLSSRPLYICVPLKKQSLFHTLWFSKGRLLPVGGACLSMLWPQVQQSQAPSAVSAVVSRLIGVLSGTCRSRG